VTNIPKISIYQKYLYEQSQLDHILSSTQHQQTFAAGTTILLSCLMIY